MKKVLLLCISFLLLLSVVSCDSIENESTGSSPESKSSNQSVESVQQQSQEPDEVSYEVSYSSAITYKNSIGTVWAQIIFEVENTGSAPLYLSSGSCDLEDESGKLIANKTYISVYPSVIDAGEKAYYYETTTLNDLDDAIKLNIIPRPAVKKAKVDNIRLPVSDVSLKDETHGGIKAIGRVENNTSDIQKSVYIAAILFDSDDKPIGQIFTILTEDLKAGDKIGFEASSLSMPDDIKVDSVARYEVFAYPLQYQF